MSRVLFWHRSRFFVVRERFVWRIFESIAIFNLLIACVAMFIEQWMIRLGMEWDWDAWWWLNESFALVAMTNYTLFKIFPILRNKKRITRALKSILNATGDNICPAYMVSFELREYIEFKVTSTLLYEKFMWFVLL